MNILKLLIVTGLLFYSTEFFCQVLPPSYQPMLNEIVEHFETIRGTNTVNQGKSTLGVINENKIALRVEHNKQVKNLTFEKRPDEENKLYWIAANELTADMVNKYEKYLTKTLKSMHKISEQRSKQ